LISSFLKKELISFVLKTYSNLDYEDAENYVTAMFSYRFAKIVYIYIKWNKLLSAFWTWFYKQLNTLYTQNGCKM
jgi:hypothetical protein